MASLQRLTVPWAVDSMISMRDTRRDQTRKATAKLMRQREAKAADLLLERGWVGMTTPRGTAWPDPMYVEKPDDET